MVVADRSTRSAYVYYLVGPAWNWIQTFTNVVSDPGHLHNSAVISGNGLKVAFGDYQSNQATVYHESSPSVWTPLGNGNSGIIPGEFASDATGEAVALNYDGTRIAVADSYHNNNQGRVRVRPLKSSNALSSKSHPLFFHSGLFLQWLVR
jgi:hypothetical protein